MSRVPSISHYLERAADAAALVAAISMAREHPDGFLHHAPEAARDELVARQRRLLEDCLHDFAFTGRKLIELVRRERLPSAPLARAPSILCYRMREVTPSLSNDAGDLELSLEDVFGRIIHSDDFIIDRSAIDAEVPDRQASPAFWAFEVASDRDKAAGPMLVFVELMLVSYLNFESRVRAELWGRGPKLAP